MCPFTKFEDSEAKKITGPNRSSTYPNLFIGILLSTQLSFSLFFRKASEIAVTVKTGAIALM